MRHRDDPGHRRRPADDLLPPCLPGVPQSVRLFDLHPGTFNHPLLLMAWQNPPISSRAAEPAAVSFPYPSAPGLRPTAE
jgi:hypothetical protein